MIVRECSLAEVAAVFDATFRDEDIWTPTFSTAPNSVRSDASAWN